MNLRMFRKATQAYRIVFIKFVKKLKNKNKYLSFCFLICKLYISSFVFFVFTEKKLADTFKPNWIYFIP